MSYFLYGSMSPEGIRHVIMGTVDGAQAQLSGYSLEARPKPFALAFRDPNSTLDGLYVSGLSADQSDRVRFFLDVIGELQLGECRVDGAVQTVQFVSGSKVRREGNDLLGQAEVYAAQEIMGYFGRLSAVAVRPQLAMILARAEARQAAQTPKPAVLRSSTGLDQITQHSMKTPHEGFFLTRSYRLQHPKFDGSTSPELTREAFVATDAAIVLPYDPVRDRVLLIEQFRMGPYARGDAKPWMLEPVAGRVDGGESPETCARRECEEEAGLTLHELRKISSHYCSPGCSSEYFHLFLGLCDLPDDAAGHGGLETEHEDLKVHVIDYADAMALLDSGEADNGPLVLALLWLSKSRDALRASA